MCGGPTNTRIKTADTTRTDRLLLVKEISNTGFTRKNRRGEKVTAPRVENFLKGTERTRLRTLKCYPQSLPPVLASGEIVAIPEIPNGAARMAPTQLTHIIIIIEIVNIGMVEALWISRI